MKQEDKKLLIQDIMARLPYDPKFDLDGIRGSIHHISIYPKYKENKIDDYICSIDFFGDGNYIDIEHFKPYLFPLSSMTATQVKEFYRIKGLNLNNEELIRFKSNYLSVVSNISSYSWSIDWLNKHHFDYRGLIEKGLAIDATGLNIY